MNLRPMLATLAHELPASGEWSYEMKWDGVRALVLVHGGRITIRSRNDNDVTSGYPELRALGEQLGSTEVLLDGEIVALDENARPSFQRLQQRMHVRDATAVRHLQQQVPVVFIVFDVLWIDGILITDFPYRERRERLDALKLRGPSWLVPPMTVGDGPVVLSSSQELGFEGVIAKRLDSKYLAGKRSPAWLKIKNQMRQEFVIGGWTPGNGARSQHFGALLVGYYDDDGALRFAGKVGTGFTDAELQRLTALLQPLQQDAKPFIGPGVPRDAQFVAPKLVAEVRFSEWTDAGHIRHPAYLGLRDDKLSTDVIRE